MSWLVTWSFSALLMSWSEPGTFWIYAGMTGTDVLIDRRVVGHAILHYADISDLVDLKANWVWRPEFLSQVLMDMKVTGGLGKWPAGTSRKVAGSLQGGVPPPPAEEGG